MQSKYYSIWTFVCVWFYLTFFQYVLLSVNLFVPEMYIPQNKLSVYYKTMFQISA